MAHFANPRHFSTFPSEHANEYALYDEVRPDATQAPTGLTLHAGEETKSYIDDFGVAQSPPASFSYLPATAGQRHTLTTQSYVSTYGTRTYTNTIKFSNKLGGLWDWNTKIDDTVGPTTFNISWLVIDGDGVNLPGTGSGMQCVEANQERWADNDVYDDDYAHHNPTQNGAGQALQNDPAGPYGGYSDPHTALRVYGPPLLHYAVSATTFEAGGYYVDFGGDGFATTATLGHANVGDTPTRPRVWYSRRWFQRIVPNYTFNGALTTKAMIHKAIYWSYSPTSWDVRGVSGPILNYWSSNLSCKPLYFDKAYLFDLALGSSSAVDVDTLGDTDYPTWAPSGPGIFWIPTWYITQREILRPDGTALPGYGSPYRGAAIRCQADDFVIAVVSKLGQVTDDGGHTASPRIGNSNGSIRVSQFVTPATTTAIDTGYCSHFGMESKSETLRPAGWVGKVHYTVIGRLSDVQAALDELYSSGALDLDIETDLPSSVTSGTIWPPGNSVAATVDETNIVVGIGDSQVGSGSSTYLQSDENPSLAKFPKTDPA